MAEQALILGVDPASTKLAFYVLSPLTPTVVSHKVILGKKYEPVIANAAWQETLLLGDIFDTMCGARSRPRCAFIESPVVGRGGIRSSVVQAFTSGAVQACLVELGFTVYLTHPSTWKTWLTGKPTCKKPEIERVMRNRFPKDWAATNGDGDLIDAAALARYGYETVRRGSLVASVRGM